MFTGNRVRDALGAVGIDLDALIEGDTTADAIQRYGKGDRTVALRRIAGRVKDPVALARVRELFQDDGDFRALASRYQREFERLLAQAGEADPDELLFASLLTADVGKASPLLSPATHRPK